MGVPWYDHPVDDRVLKQSESDTLTGLELLVPYEHTPDRLVFLHRFPGIAVKGGDASPAAPRVHVSRRAFFLAVFCPGFTAFPFPGCALRPVYSAGNLGSSLVVLHILVRPALRLLRRRCRNSRWCRTPS